MEGTKKKPVVVSLLFFSSVDQIFEYGKINFGEKKAIEYENLIYETVRQLTSGYLLNAEYPYLPTKISDTEGPYFPLILFFIE